MKYFILLLTALVFLSCWGPTEPRCQDIKINKDSLQADSTKIIIIISVCSRR